MEASLTCAVCLGVFREPVTLPRCSHNFCKCCVLECATPQRGTVVQPTNGEYRTVSCPLCRKVSTLYGDLAALPVNTTLAEVVRLLPLNGRAKESHVARGSSGNPDSWKNSCVEHPEYKLELFCKNCEQPCCGKCVSLRHQGIFHNVNLLDMIYQEEKLLFFGSLKTLREIHERLSKEMPDNEENAEQTILKANEDAVTLAFGEVQKALDLKRQQLVDLVKQQQSASMKRSEVRKVTKAHHRTTVESLLKDCENLVDDYEPRSFLEVACGLNKRMKSNFELIEFCTDHNKDLRCEPQCVDVQAVLDAVSTLKTTSRLNDRSKPNGSFSFKTISRNWDRGMATNEKYCPVQDQELIYLQGQMQKLSIRFVCITLMPEYQHLSYEELRLKYYESSVVQENEAYGTPGPFLCNNNQFDFKMSLLSSVNATALKDGFGRELTVYGKDLLKIKSTKTDHGRMEQKNSLFALKDSPFKAQDFPSSSSGGLTIELSSAIKAEKTPKLCNDLSNKTFFPNFCLGKSENATKKKSSRNKKSCIKQKSMACLPELLSAGSAKSTPAVADNTAPLLSALPIPLPNRSPGNHSPSFPKNIR